MMITELFAAQRETLRQELREAATPDQAVSHARHVLDRLQLDCQARTDLTPMQARLMPYLFDVLKSAVAQLLAASETHVWEKQATPRPPASTRSASVKFLHFFSISHAFLWKIGQALIGFLLLSSLWHHGHFFSLLLMIALLLSLFADYVPFDWDFLPDNKRSRWQAEVQLDLQVFMLQFDDLLITADKLITEAGRQATSDPIREGDGLEAFPRLLAWCQDLLEAKDYEDSKYALKKAQELPGLLHKEGKLDIVHYTPDNADYFEVFPSLDPNDTDIRTLTPALTRSGRLVSQGRATEPHHAD